MSNTDPEYDLFLSHASEDGVWAERLAKRLRGHGVRVWFDKWELRGGDKLTERINQGIENSRQMAVVWTSRYFAEDKEWTQAEQASRHHADLRGKRRLLLPIWREDCKIPALLADLLRIDFRNEDQFEQAIGELLDALCLPSPMRRNAPQADDSRNDDEAHDRRPTKPAIADPPTSPASVAALSPVLRVLSILFIGMLAFGVLLVCKGEMVLGTLCVVLSGAACLGFLYIYTDRRIRGAPISGQEFALIRNTTTLLSDHSRSAAERRTGFSVDE